MERINPLKIFFKKKKIGFICNNAGGGYLIKYLIKKYHPKYKIIFKGTSKNFFKKKKSYNEKFFFNKINVLMCGTSFPGDFEIKYFLKAKKKKIKTISLLDHWGSYKDRFKIGKKFYFPDEIWCGDKDSYLIAKNQFNNVNIKLFKNPIFQDYKSMGQSCKNNKNQNNILYLSGNFYRTKSLKRKPIRLNEDKILLKTIQIYQKKKFKHIYFRPHPSDYKKKIPNLLKNLRCKLDNSKELFHILSKIKLAIGTNSAALVLAKIYGCKTMNILPKNMKNTLPKKYIDEIIKI